MSHTPDARPRREFLGQLAATVALASVACAPATSIAAAPAPAPGSATATPPAAGAAAAKAPQEPVHWDDSWTTTVLAAKHKAVFDGPEIADGEAPGQAWLFYQGLSVVKGITDADVVPVVVMRHMGVPVAFNDHLWDKYQLGKWLKQKDPTTGKPARRNPYAHADNGDKYANLAPDGTLPELRRRGAVLLACARAANYFAYEIAERTKQPFPQLKEEVKANLIDGVILQPSGVYAVLRAQEVGCAYIRAT
ncbi:MAG: hypothetical protein ACREOE_05380 [Gemmatimonadales bacterium]